MCAQFHAVDTTHNLTKKPCQIASNTTAYAITTCPKSAAYATLNTNPSIWPGKTVASVATLTTCKRKSSPTTSSELSHWQEKTVYLSCVRKRYLGDATEASS